MPLKHAQSDIKKSLDHMSKVRPSLLFPLHPPHLTQVLAGARLAFDLTCVLSVGDTRCPVRCCRVTR